MNKYSESSLTKLKECDFDLQRLFYEVLAGIDNTILTGHRNEETQNEAYANGQSKLKWPQSKHNSKPSMAIDVSPYPIPKHWGDKDRNEYEKFRYFGFYVLGVADSLYNRGTMHHRLRWGGDWDGDKDVLDQNFNDLVHFELFK